MDIPVFHDDQHGTAIISGAGLINGRLLRNKKIERSAGRLLGRRRRRLCLRKVLSVALGVRART
jgi:malate dehydrogenase (oxaloacetate-decarboxylating)(NADP+)